MMTRDEGLRIMQKSHPGAFFRLYTFLDLDCFPVNFNFSNPYTSTRLPLFARNVVSTSHPLGGAGQLACQTHRYEKSAGLWRRPVHLGQTVGF